MAKKTTLTAVIVAAGAALMFATTPSAVGAGTTTGCGCKSPPPPPPPPPPPHNCGCGTGGHGGHGGHGHGGQTLNVVTNVNVNNQVNTTVNTSSMVSSVLSNSISNANNASVSVTGNGSAMSNGGIGSSQTSGSSGGGGYVSSGAVSEASIGVGGQEGESYESERTKIEKVVIQAFCFDDKDVPHPASQVTPDREIAQGYEGEVYRCIAGAHMQVTVAPWQENISFQGGQTITCQKGEALYYSSYGGGRGDASGASGAAMSGGGRITCRAQIPARDCNERSLLRRFGAGIKVLTIVITEKYTAYRESTQGTTTSMSFDGGVGGVMN